MNSEKEGQFLAEETALVANFKVQTSGCRFHGGGLSVHKSFAFRCRG